MYRELTPFRCCCRSLVPVDGLGAGMLTILASEPATLIAVPCSGGAEMDDGLDDAKSVAVHGPEEEDETREMGDICCSCVEACNLQLSCDVDDNGETGE